jgi:predicted RecA/RadA family phage recombinase
MEAQFIHDGAAIDYVPTAATPAGSVIVQGKLVGITKRDIEAGQLGTIHLTGVYDMNKASAALTTGTSVYWDATNKCVTATATNNTLLGTTVAPAGANDATARVLLNG